MLVKHYLTLLDAICLISLNPMFKHVALCLTVLDKAFERFCLPNQKTTQFRA